MSRLSDRYSELMENDMAGASDELAALHEERFLDPAIDLDAVNGAVCHEGWAIFDSSGSSNGPLQIQRFDDPGEWDDFTGDPLGDDEEAWMLVVSKARAGSSLHQAALDAILIGNPIEAENINRWFSMRQLPAHV